MVPVWLPEITKFNGTVLGVPRIRTVVLGTPTHGSYHIRSRAILDTQNGAIRLTTYRNRLRRVELRNFRLKYRS